MFACTLKYFRKSTTAVDDLLSRSWMINSMWRKPENYFALYPMGQVCLWSPPLRQMYHFTLLAVNLAVSSASFLVSPSCLSEYFTALALLLLSVLITLLSYSALFLCYTILLFCKFSTMFSSFSTTFSCTNLLNLLYIFIPSVFTICCL